MTTTTTLVAVIVVKHLNKLLVTETLRNADDKDITLLAIAVVTHLKT